MHTLARLKALMIPLALLMTCAIHANGQASNDSVTPLLEKPVQPTAVTAYQLQKYMMRRITKPLLSATSEQWTAEAEKVRQRILQDIIFHGWPQEWITAPPHFEQTQVIETGHGYRLRKFNYEIVPGLQSTAVLYEPDTIRGRVPAILNVVATILKAIWLSTNRSGASTLLSRACLRSVLAGWVTVNMDNRKTITTLVRISIS
jgi:hypothetical protein